MKQQILAILNEFAKKEFDSFGNSCISKSDFPELAERLEQLNGWVSVETPPSNAGFYLVVVDESVSSKLRGQVEIGDCYKSVVGGVLLLKFQDYVTHWKHLPSPPKQS